MSEDTPFFIGFPGNRLLILKDPQEGEGGPHAGIVHHQAQTVGVQPGNWNDPLRADHRSPGCGPPARSFRNFQVKALNPLALGDFLPQNHPVDLLRSGPAKGKADRDAGCRGQVISVLLPQNPFRFMPRLRGIRLQRGLRSKVPAVAAAEIFPEFPEPLPAGCSAGRWRCRPRISHRFQSAGKGA